MRGIGGSECSVGENALSLKLVHILCVELWVAHQEIGFVDGDGAFSQSIHQLSLKGRVAAIVRGVALENYEFTGPYPSFGRQAGEFLERINDLGVLCRQQADGDDTLGPYAYLLLIIDPNATVSPYAYRMRINGLDHRLPARLAIN